MVNAALKATIPMLKEVRLLRALTESELGSLIQLGTSVAYQPHANIIIEGELTWGLYLILEGTVGVFKSNKLTSDVYDVGQLRQGQFFGEMSLVEDNPRSATVKALTECNLFYLSKEAFIGFLQKSPDLKARFYEACIKDLANRLRELDDNYVVSQYQLWKSAVQGRMKKEVA